MNLSSLLHRTSIHRPEVFTQAVTIIQSLETQPSCNRIATVALINSCQSQEVSATDAGEGAGQSELLLDEVKSEYAARLAICELTGAKADIPPQCTDLIPSQQACKNGGLWNLYRRTHRQGLEGQTKVCYPEITQHQFVRCQTALGSRAQWWTSYSNARQNAVVMCQASRDAIEKGISSPVYVVVSLHLQGLTTIFLTRLYRHCLLTNVSADRQLAANKAMVDVTSDLTSALSKSLQDATVFAKAVGEMQAQVLRENEQGFMTSRSAFSKLTVDIQSAIESMLGITFRAAGDMEDAVNGLRQVRRQLTRSKPSF